MKYTHTFQITTGLLKYYCYSMIKYAGILLASLLVGGFIYEHIERLYFNRRKPADSRFVHIGNRKLHFKKQGTGNLTVVFESGLGGDHLHWKEIQKQLAKKYTTLSYDRAGILWSDRAEEVSLKRYENDLWQLLQRTNCPKPYIIVGHSFAGITLRPFINTHASDIAGIVFVDVTHPDQLDMASDKLKNSASIPPKWLLFFLNETGVLRLIYSLTPFTEVVPKEHWFNKNIGDYFYRILPGLIQEIENDKKLMAQASRINSFGSIPLRIITAKYPNGVERIPDSSLAEEYLHIHMTLQQKLLTLSSNSKQIIAEKSGHYITLQQPDLIIKMVKDITQ